MSSEKSVGEERQLVALREIAVPEECIYIDKQTGKDFERAEYKKLMRRIRRGDILYVKNIDRLGRNYEEIQNQWRILTKERGVDICVIDMSLLDTRRGKDLLGSFVSDLTLQILSFIAEYERDNVRQRQAEGIAAAKARDTKFGRPERVLPANFHEVCLLWHAGKLNLNEAAAECGFPRSTFYDKAREYGGKGRRQEKRWSGFEIVTESMVCRSIKSSASIYLPKYRGWPIYPEKYIFLDVQYLKW